MPSLKLGLFAVLALTALLPVSSEAAEPKVTVTDVTGRSWLGWYSSAAS